jgi:ribonuclease BN (tRNA processing enzyme)
MATNNFSRELPTLSLNAAEIIAALKKPQRRILLFGPVAIGKSTLTNLLAEALTASQHHCWCLNADPGSPAFGAPGTISLAQWQQNQWQVNDYTALCTLDAGRFRLPLVSAVSSLVSSMSDEMLLIDTPGVVRGVAGRELLLGLTEATEADVILALTSKNKSPPLQDELCHLPAEVYVVHAAVDAARPGKRVRARQRTAQWDGFLADATEQQLDLARINLIGTPPPLEEPHGWIGRQVAVLQADRTLAMGEVQYIINNKLTMISSARIKGADTLLIRDANRNADGLLETATAYAAERYEYLPPADVVPTIADSTGPRIVGRVGAVDVGLINGVFGDPLLHLRVRQQRRSLLFDLGDGSRLPARIAHQVTDVFISHAHLDHIGGFLWLLRSRIGDYPPCRLYGPPGLAQNIAGFLQGILWDRVADCGPSFEVLELHGDRLKRFRLQAGYAEQQSLDEIKVVNDQILKEPGFSVNGIRLDHHGTPVIAYAFQPDKQINVRKDRVLARGLEPGPWLNKLKQAILSGNETSIIELPDGNQESAGALAIDLVIITPGKKLAYATDLADTRQNRQQLISLAQHAHTFFCEAAFVEADVDHAIRNGHLTTRACGEIANQAGVARLVPFHFSRRYSDNPQQLYEELKFYCPRVLMPKSLNIFDTTTTSLEPVIEFDN